MTVRGLDLVVIAPNLFVACAELIADVICTSRQIGR